MDGDGDLDVLLGNSGSPNRVLLNAGDGTFPMSIELPGGSARTNSIAAADVDGDGDLDVLLGNEDTPSRLLPFIRCSQPGTARSLFGNGCVRCPAPFSRRDDHFDICYECEEHTELDYRGECSSCKPGSVRFVGAAECTACPRGKRQGKAGTLCVDCSSGSYAPYDGLFGPACLPCERGSFCPPGAAAPVPCHEGSNSSATDLARDEQCPHAPPHAPPLSPPTPPAAPSAAARDMMAQSYEQSHVVLEALLVAFLVAMAVAFVACCLWRRWRTRISTQMLKDNADSVSMHMVPIWAPKQRETLSSSGGSPVTVRSDEPTQLEVVDFSTLAVGRPIGEGGFATVWSARWQGNDLAVKVLNMKLENVDMSPAQQELVMLQEVAILRRLRHPCICALFGHMLVDQRPALVLEYMAGGSLAAHLFANRYAAAAPVAPQGLLGCKLMEPPPPRTRLADMLSDDKKICFAVQLASGLCFLHSHGILHHDIKTDNALLDANHSVCKLADFGLACLSLNYARDRNKAVGGTLRYLAPERVAEVSRRHAHESPDRDESRGSSSLSLGRTLVSFEDRADVYAFGLLLWELIHERRAFEELTGAAAASGALKGLRPQLSKPSKSDGIPALTCECWAQRPEDRPSMSTVLERLETCMQALSAPSSTSMQMWLQCSDPSSPSALSCSNESRRAAISGCFSAKLPVQPDTSVPFSSEYRRGDAIDFVPWEEHGPLSQPQLRPAPDSSRSTRSSVRTEVSTK
jgi:serine/threonine protein kinase